MTENDGTVWRPGGPKTVVPLRLDDEPARTVQVRWRPVLGITATAVVGFILVGLGYGLHSPQEPARTPVAATVTHQATATETATLTATERLTATKTSIRRVTRTRRETRTAVVTSVRTLPPVTTTLPQVTVTRTLPRTTHTVTRTVRATITRRVPLR